MKALTNFYKKLEGDKEIYVFSINIESELDHHKDVKIFFVELGDDDDEVIGCNFRVKYEMEYREVYNSFWVSITDMDVAFSFSKDIDPNIDIKLDVTINGVNQTKTIIAEKYI